MANYIDNYQNIKKTLQQAFGSTDMTDNFQNILQVKKQIDNYLKRYEQMSNKIYNKYMELAQEDNIQSQTARRYQAVKSFNQQTDDVKNLLKEGYLYVDAIRQALTGEKIKYQIGFIDKSDRLQQGEIDILDLIQYSTLDVDSKISIKDAAKLRLTRVEGNKLINPIQQVLQHDTEQASSVFSAVFNYLTVTLHKIPKVNRGNAYQVYKRILFERDGQNKIPPGLSFERIDQVYEEVKRNNAPYYKGGDISNIQVKYLGGSPPSLTSLSSIKRVLTKVSSALDVVKNNTKQNQKLAKSLASLLTQKSSNINTKIEQQANNRAYNQILKRINSLQQYIKKS